MKKSFIIHNDSVEILEKLSDEQAGQLFRAICAYQIGESIDLDYVMELVFSPFQKQFERDAVKYDELCEKNRNIALKRYSTSGTSGNQSLPKAPNVTKSTDKDSDSDSDSDSKSNLKERELFDSFRKSYAGKKRGNDTEFDNFVKKHKDWQTVLPIIAKLDLTWESEARFIPMFQTWINNRNWELESESIKRHNPFANAI